MFAASIRSSLLPLVKGVNTKASSPGGVLFLTGFLILFVELASIRWFAATVVFLQFFTNIIMLASFLGMSCGCLAARQRRNWLESFPAIAFFCIFAAMALLVIYSHWSGLTIDVGHQANPQEVFFGTEYRNADVAQFAVPIEWVAGSFFVLIALMFVGFGQELGRAFDRCPNRIAGYSLNIAGSLLGITLFFLISLAQARPWTWFLIASAGAAYLLQVTGSLTRPRLVTLGGIVAIIALQGADWGAYADKVFWSPYYSVAYRPDTREIEVNNIGHQTILPFDSRGSNYSLIHLLQRAAGGKPFEDVLIIGAGSGNDMEHALHFGARHIDAVEIDPVIQRIGISENPDRPYADDRVQKHLDDGRHFLRTTDRKYDLVIYALVDSLILHSGYANIRLESYLFTTQAFDDIKKVLKPDGVFVTYNYFRQGWVVERVAAMAKSAFGCDPTIITLPHQEALPSSSPAGFAMIVAGCNHRIGDALAKRGDFWLNIAPPENLKADGFSVHPESLPPEERSAWYRIGTTRIVPEYGTPMLATDDWPFLYLRGRLVPGLTIRSTALLGVIGAAMIFIFLPKRGKRFQFNQRMFFLGAAFMLLETKAVVQLALLFGSTWTVNSAVFFTVLVLLLLANLFVLKARPTRMFWPYAGLIALLALATAVPMDSFLNGGALMRYVAPCALALGPIFFAGVIFARSFQLSADADMAFGSNIAGSLVGGLSEAFSMLLGFRYLLIVAIAFYLLSAVVSLPKPRTTA